ncbi:EfeM/EfeO family lipoprotein [Gloeocapsa sp. PCC 73106]|uniref:EfeM/EfeO family lipoprotein n=1 Tax=Gloeocapsa sp. PCC 73106 TaxID=102232 RepID=UPI0002ABEBA6|nr:EfeM/EfeO family lipoprotein [Gloeocapsa sp. PCC 73106]ELR96758.1 putative periplasmic lipoprotein involved in iron transport [Gloeocapsa sp. PCC 73106]
MQKIIRFSILVISVIALLAVTNLKVIAQSEYSEQVQTGINYFKVRADEQLSLVQELLAALKTNDLETAQQAYVNSRPPYEEIEVFAASFPQEDSDIDARPYAFEQGESSEEFRGFHRIEGFIYRDKNLEAAIPYGEGLVASVESLINQLNEPSNFNASLNFQGMITLANEVPSKKISSEEETWSDQSLLIFKHNWIGIHSQYEPFAVLVKAKNPAVAAQVEETYQACLKSVEPYFTEGTVAATPFSSLNNQQRGEIVKASYQFRDALIEAREVLGLA